MVCKTQATRRSRSTQPTPLSKVPLRQWFANEALWRDFQDYYMKKPILKPRYLPEGLIPEDRYYPRLMVVVATTLRIEDNLDGNGNGEFYIVFKLAGVKYALDLDELASIWDLRNGGVLSKGGRNPPKYMGRLYHERAIETLRLSSLSGGKYSVRNMTTDHRLIHFMLSYVLIPRAGNHGTVREEDLIILLVMVQEVGLNWPFLLAYQFYYYSIRQVESGLGHGMLWTKVFEYLGIHLSGEEAVLVGEDNAITQRQLNQMRRNLNVASAGNIADEAGDEDIPQQPVVGPAQQFPLELMESFSQGIQSFRSAWGENSLNLGKQLDSFETQLTRQGEEIHGLGEEIRGWFNQFPRSGGQSSHGDAPSQG
ncbi:hypothetical protein PIB30_092872 [Stylosanthes scabra]|uniref:Uncharacterized protein n=1 Tax=Stylosanthes scabra TaxID=79078 RepID=A0ABU6SVD7_9FABA|nr:hypothetical protein [Stylosanthes scabra]